MKRCASDDCPAYRRLGRHGEYDEGAAACADCGGPLSPSPAEPIERADEAGDPRLGRLFVTVLCAGLFVAGMLVTAPGVDLSALQDGPLLGRQSPPAFRHAASLLRQGVEPFVSAAVVVELVALLVPRWRAARQQGPEGRRGLDLAAAALGLVLGLINTVVFVNALPADASTDARWATLPALALGLLAPLLLAHLTSRQGLIGGLALFSIAQRVLYAVNNEAVALCQRGDHGRFPAESLLLHGAAAAAVVYVTLRLLGSGRGGAGGQAEGPDGGGPYRGAEAGAEAAVRVPLPASGVVPLTLGLSLFVLVNTLWTLGAPLTRLTLGLARANRDAWLSSLASLALVAPLAWAFSAPSRVAAVYHRSRRPAEGQPGSGDVRFGPALARTFAFVGLIIALQAVSHTATGSSPDLVAVALAAALAADAASIWKLRGRHDALAVAAVEHRPYAAEALLERLGREGIEAAGQGLHLRTMLQFFGPYVPISVMVPAADAARARAIARKVLSLPGAKRRASRPG